MFISKSRNHSLGTSEGATMKSHNFFHDAQSSRNVDGVEQGTWQQPTQNTYGQGAIYYSGAPHRYFNQNQSESPLNRSITSDSDTSFSHASRATNSAMANHTYNRNVGQSQTNSFRGSDLDNSNPGSATTVCNSAHNNSYYCNYGYPSHSQGTSYNTSNNATGMGQTATNCTDIPEASGYQKSSYNEYNGNGMHHSERGGLGGSCVFDDNMVGINDGGDNRKKGNDMDNNSKNSGSFHGESDVQASGHFGHFQNSINFSSFSNSRGYHYKMRRGDFSGGRRMTSGNFGWRGQGSSRGHFHRSEPYHPNNPHNFITLNATHRNQWGYHRKYFNKSNDELAEHLFKIHDLFCTRCQQREEERKAKTGHSQDEDTNKGEKAKEEILEEELTEEELQMRNVMGFSGFTSTKGSRKTDNTFENVLSVIRSKNDLEETTTLTEEERRRILSIGGYSVFSKRSSNKKPEFGAPAVTMDPLDNQEQNDSSASLCTNEQTESGKTV